MVLLLLHLLWIAKVKNWEQCLSLTPTPYLCFWEWKNNEHLLYSSSYLWEAGKKFAFHPHLFHSLLLRLKSYPPLLKIIIASEKKAAFYERKQLPSNERLWRSDSHARRMFIQMVSEHQSLWHDMLLKIKSIGMGVINFPSPPSAFWIKKI